MLLSLASRKASSIAFVLGTNKGPQMHFTKKGRFSDLMFSFTLPVFVMLRHFSRGKKYYMNNYAKPCWTKTKQTKKEYIRLRRSMDVRETSTKMQPGKTYTWLSCCGTTIRRGLPFLSKDHVLEEQNVHCASKEIWLPFRLDYKY